MVKTGEIWVKGEPVTVHNSLSQLEFDRAIAKLAGAKLTVSEMDALKIPKKSRPKSP